MNISETTDFLTKFERLQPAYAAWRNEQALLLARTHGTKPQDEVFEIVGGVARQLEQVTSGEAFDALIAFESGDLGFPPYGELASVVREFALATREGKRAAPQFEDHDGDQRWSCPDCLDTGIVEIFNPAFVVAFRPEFDDLPRPLPKGWFRVCYGWWLARRAKGNPMTHVALCDCDCPRRRIQATELEKWAAGRRMVRVGKKNIAAGPPACGAVRWDRDKSPRIPCPVMAAATLADWYSRRLA